MKSPSYSLLTLAGTLALSLTSASAENWSNWRGPNFDGSSPETGLPTEVTKETAVWTTDLPGIGSSTPVVWGDALFVTAVNEDRGGVDALKLNSQTGEIEWQRAISKSTRRDNRSTFAGPSAVTDGEAVFFFTGTGELVSYDFAGKENWNLNIAEKYGEFAFGWTFSTSPLLTDGKLIIQVLQRDTPVDGRGFSDKDNESYLLALDPKTGDEIYRQLRPSAAVMESREAFTTPTPIVHNGRNELLVVGGDALTGHDPATGKELWRWGTWNPDQEPYWRLVPSPVYGDGIILACAPKKHPIYAVKAGATGDVSGEESALAWIEDSKETTSDVPTPLFYEGHFYILNGGLKFLSCVEPETGKVLWAERLDAKVKVEASPTGADGKIYVQSHLGELFVLQAGEEFKLLHQTMLGTPQSTNIRASVVPANGALYVRTDSQVFAFKEKN